MGKENKINIKGFKNLKKPERFVFHQEDDSIAKVENLARKTGSTKSWIIRAVLVALEKKFRRGLPDKYFIKRPKKFKRKFRQTTVCFYGDRQKWFSLCRIWKVELGPLIRFALDLYESGELELDLESESTVKEIETINRGINKRQKIRNDKKKENRFRYLYRNVNNCYENTTYWSKNPEGNRELMEWGLLNRIYPLKLPPNFKIPECFGG